MLLVITQLETERRQDVNGWRSAVPVGAHTGGAPGCKARGLPGEAC